MAANQPSIQGLALANEPPIPLKAKIKIDDYELVSLTRMVNDEKRKATLFKLTEDDAEMICRVVLEFRDAASAERLSLTTGPLLFSKFRELLGTTFREEFDRLRVVHNATEQGFRNATTAFILIYIKGTDLLDEQHYLDNVRKPFNLSVKELGTRLQLVNRLLALFPGANGVAPYNEQGIKYCFYKMMLPEWKTNFLIAGHAIEAPNYSYAALVNYMHVQATVMAQRQQRRGLQGGPQGQWNRRSTGQDSRPSQYRRLGYQPHGRGYQGRGQGYQGRGYQGYQGQRWSYQNQLSGRGMNGGRRNLQGGRGNFQGGRVNFQGGRGYYQTNRGSYYQGRGDFSANRSNYYQGRGQGPSGNVNSTSNGTSTRPNGQQDVHVNEPVVEDTQQPWNEEQARQEFYQEPTQGQNIQYEDHQEQEQDYSQEQFQEQPQEDVHWLDNFGYDNGDY